MRILIVPIIVMVCGTIFAETNTISTLAGLVLTAEDIQHVEGTILFQNARRYDKTVIKDGKKVPSSVQGFGQEVQYRTSTLLLSYGVFESSDVAYLSAKELADDMSIRMEPGIWTNASGLTKMGDYSRYGWVPEAKQIGLTFQYDKLCMHMGGSARGGEDMDKRQGLLKASEAIIKKYDMAMQVGAKTKANKEHDVVSVVSGVILTTNDFQKLDMSIITQRVNSFSRARSLHSVYGIGQTINCRSGEFRLHYGLFENKEDAYLSAKEFPLIIIGPGIWTNSPSLKKVGDCAWYVFQGATHIVLLQYDKLCVMIEAPGERRTLETKMQGTLELAETIIRKYDVGMRRNDAEQKGSKTVQ